MGPTHGYAQHVIREALVASTGGLDLDVACQAIQDAVEALKKQAEALKQSTYDRNKPDSIARAFHHTAKVIDEITRLMEFAKGHPDSRPDLGSDWLRVLTDEQLAQVMRWVKENEQAEQAEIGEQEP